MARLQMPYQCMQKCGNTLVAARGSSIDLFNLEDGSLFSTWNYLASQTLKNEKVEVGTSEDGEAGLEETVSRSLPRKSELSSLDPSPEMASPPPKRRKLSTSGEDVETEDLKNSKSELKTEPTSKKVTKRGSRQSAVSSGLQTPAIISLAVTKGGQYVVAVTGEDKSIRVFENIEDNATRTLRQLSQRAMPKRPCALAITLDDTTIISADKFGDVYSLPLLPSEAPVSTPSGPQIPDPTPTKPFVPAANELTIHSQRNRKALENQRRQTNKTPKEKFEPSFEHALLLGHVSLLTDLALVTLEEKNYIITADRDEHIRVSRGIPQAHIIEGFCLGHTEFVSRICIPDGRPDVLISGGGDEELYIWEWKEGRLLSRTNLQDHVIKIKLELGQGKENEVPAEPSKFAVSGIYHTSQNFSSGSRDIIIITCEGLPALFTFTLTSQNSLEYLQTLKLPGNALAVVTNLHKNDYAREDHVLVSIDTIHAPGSTTMTKDITSSVNPLQTWAFPISSDGILVMAADLVLPLPSENLGNALDSVLGQMKNLLYNFGNLRKRDTDGLDE